MYDWMGIGDNGGVKESVFSSIISTSTSLITHIGTSRHDSGRNAPRGCFLGLSTQ
jgi:hypothetical protein